MLAAPFRFVVTTLLYGSLSCLCLARLHNTFSLRHITHTHTSKIRSMFCCCKNTQKKSYTKPISVYTVMLDIDDNASNQPDPTFHPLCTESPSLLRVCLVLSELGFCVCVSDFRRHCLIAIVAGHCRAQKTPRSRRRGEGRLELES